MKQMRQVVLFRAALAGSGILVFLYTALHYAALRSITQLIARSLAFANHTQNVKFFELGMNGADPVNNVDG